MNKVETYQYREVSQDDISAIDLREEDPISAIYAQVSFKLEGKEFFEETGPEILYYPDEGRAGIAWDADAEWTDAHSIENAIDRFFDLDGWEMRN